MLNYKNWLFSSDISPSAPFALCGSLLMVCLDGKCLHIVTTLHRFLFLGTSSFALFGNFLSFFVIAVILVFLHSFLGGLSISISSSYLWYKLMEWCHWCTIYMLISRGNTSKASNDLIQLQPIDMEEESSVNDILCYILSQFCRKSKRHWWLRSRSGLKRKRSKMHNFVQKYIYIQLMGTMSISTG